MEIQTEQDFPKLRTQIQVWRQRFPMFKHDVDRIESAVEQHIKNYSIALVNYRQTKKKSYLEQAQHEIDEINRVVSLIEKLELLALLSRG